MNQIIFEIVLIAMLIIINGLFSMTEIAVVSSRRVRLMQDAEAGSAGAAMAVELQEKPDRFLSTVQIGITLVGILSGAFGGATVAQTLGGYLAEIPAIAPYAQTISFTFVILIITYFSLVIGELVPKNLALNRPEAIAKIFSRPMNLVSRLTAPFVWFLSNSTALVLKILRVTRATDAAITEEEIKAHIAHGTEIGILDETEQELIESVIRLDDQRITALMTSRLKIVWLNIEDDIEINRRKLIASPYSRLPVGRGSLDEIVGFVKAKDLLSKVLNGEELDLEGVLKEPLFVPETQTGLELLELFRVSHTHLAMIVNEFGATEGLITMNDVLKAIVGDLTVGGVFHPSIVRRDDGSLLLDGRLSVADLLGLLQIKELPADERQTYQTLGGFVLARMEKLPHEGSKFEWENFIFEIMDMDGRRVDKVLVTHKDAPET